MTRRVLGVSAVDMVSGGRVGGGGVFAPPVIRVLRRDQAQVPHGF